MNKFFENLFGVNWRTTIWGGLMLFFLAVNQAPTIIEFLPDTLEAWIRGISGIVVMITGAKFVSMTKDKQVTGTNGSAKRVEED